jgi:cation diffusion facilitator family transporter
VARLPGAALPEAGSGLLARPERAIWLSVAAAVLTIGLKLAAWGLSGSVGLLSDALESFVNLAGALVAMRLLLFARAPADAGHPFGHARAEYLSSGFEGLLIVGAALAIGGAAIERLLAPRPLVSLGLGVLLSVLASVVNGLTAWVLFAAARRHGAVALRADARHLMTDVWTTAGLVAGLGLVAAFDAPWIDPLLALLVGAHIAVEGLRLVREAFDGLTDAALPGPVLLAIDEALADVTRTAEVDVTARLTRQAGAVSFVTLVVAVPGDWTVARAHALADALEAAVEGAVPRAQVTVHIEPAASPSAKAVPT